MLCGRCGLKMFLQKHALARTAVLQIVCTSATRTCRAGAVHRRRASSLVSESRAWRRPTRASAHDGGFNRSMQHTMTREGGRSVADESTAANLLQRHPESIDVGALEGRLDAPPDWPSV